MRLIDAEGIEKFASHYTEFDGIPLTEREKDLVKNVCGKISGQMPTAYDLKSESTIKLSEAQVERIADNIAGLLMDEKEIVIDALANDEKQALADEIYYALKDC